MASTPIPELAALTIAVIGLLGLTCRRLRLGRMSKRTVAVDANSGIKFYPVVSVLASSSPDIRRRDNVVVSLLQKCFSP